MDDGLTVANLGCWMPDGISGEGKGDGCVERVGWSISEEMEDGLTVANLGCWMPEGISGEGMGGAVLLVDARSNEA